VGDPKSPPPPGGGAGAPKSPPPLGAGAEGVPNRLVPGLLGPKRLLVEGAGAGDPNNDPDGAGAGFDVPKGAGVGAGVPKVWIVF
jgi:hypothetical protein